MVIQSLFWEVDYATWFQLTLSPHSVGVHSRDHLSHFETFKVCFLISLLHSTLSSLRRFFLTSNMLLSMALTIRRYFRHSAFHWPWFYFFLAPFLLGVASGAVEFSAVSLVVSVFFFSVIRGRSEEGQGYVPFFWLGLFYGYVPGCFFCLPELCRLLNDWVFFFFAPLFQLFSHLCQILCHCSFRMVWTVRL